LSMRGYNGDAYNQDSGFFAVDSNLVTMAQYKGASRKSITMDTTTSQGIVVRDDVSGRGLWEYNDYSSGYTNYSYTNKQFQDTHLGGQQVNSVIYNPTDELHGGVISWDTSSVDDQYTITPVVELARAAGMMIVAFDTILFSNTSLSNAVVDLPVGAVVWDVQIFIKTAFDGSGTNLLDVGITGDGDMFVNDFDLENSATTFYGLGATPYRMIATTSVTFQYTDSGADAAAGEAYYYIKYSIH